MDVTIHRCTVDQFIDRLANDPTASMQRPNIEAYHCIIRFILTFDLLAMLFVTLFPSKHTKSLTYAFTG